MRKVEPNSSNYCNIIFPSTALKAEKSQRTFCMYRSGGCGRTWSDVPSNSRQRNWTEEVSINLQVLGYRVRLERIRTWYEEIGKLYCHATGGSSKRSPFRILSSYFFLLLFLFSLLLLVVNGHCIYLRCERAVCCGKLTNRPFPGSASLCF